MSWTNLDLKLQPCVSTAKLTISRTPVSSLHAPNLPATRGEVDLTRVNTGGVLESNRNFTQWGTWNRGGLNTCKVAKNVLTKMTGYSWVSANGALEVQRGMRRFVFKIERMTGPVQIGISAARSRSDEAALPAQRPASRAGCSVGAWPPRRRATRLMLRRAQVPETWNDPSMVNRAWFVAGSGALHNGAEVVHRSGKPLREGDMVGVEVCYMLPPPPYCRPYPYPYCTHTPSIEERGSASRSPPAPPAPPARAPTRRAARGRCGWTRRR